MNLLFIMTNIMKNLTDKQTLELKLVNLAHSYRIFILVLLKLAFSRVSQLISRRFYATYQVIFLLARF